MTFKSATQFGALISAARFRLGRVIFGDPTHLGALVATTRLGLVVFADSGLGPSFHHGHATHGSKA